jgi:hypothetical protein
MMSSRIEMRSSPWVRTDTVLHKDVAVEVEANESTFRMVFSIDRAPSGSLVPMTMLMLNFPLNPEHSQDGMWFGLRLLLGEQIGAAEAFKCIERDGDTTLVSIEKDVFTSFSNALMSEHDWQLEVRGANCVMAQCPLHNNDGFSTEFLALLESAKILNA